MATSLGGGRQACKQGEVVAEGERGVVVVRKVENDGSAGGGGEDTGATKTPGWWRWVMETLGLVAVSETIGNEADRSLFSF